MNDSRGWGRGPEHADAGALAEQARVTEASG
jgi:hypothetical protein